MKRSRLIWEFKESTPYEFARLLANAWCAAFVIPKVFVPPLEPRVTLTESTFRKLENNPNVVSLEVKDEIAKLAARYQFFHWHLAFLNVFQPKRNRDIDDEDRVGCDGGFDVVLGNPPWDTLSPDQREFFSSFVSGLRSMAPEEQERVIKELQSNATIRVGWADHRRELYASVRFMKSSGRYRLFAPGNLGKGDFNSYRMFVETAMLICKVNGFAALVVPGGFYGGTNASAISKIHFGLLSP